MTSGLARGLWTCHDCGHVVRAPEGHAHARCPRCGAPLHDRKPESLQRTWALLLGAVVLYVPANLLPVMRVTSFGRTQEDTIMSGVLFMLDHGMWPLAALIFFASVCVPLLKIVALAFLAASVQFGWTGRPGARTRLYRVTEGVGRWSMVDIYVVTILVALVQLGNLATIEAALGAVFFGGVVILTMIAAESFDPRLIWDAVAREGAPGDERRAAA